MTASTAVHHVTLFQDACHRCHGEASVHQGVVEPVIKDKCPVKQFKTPNYQAAKQYDDCIPPTTEDVFLPAQWAGKEEPQGQRGEK